MKKTGKSDVPRETEVRGCVSSFVSWKECMWHGKVACGAWAERGPGACSLSSFQFHGGYGKTLEQCQAFCLGDEPDRASRPTRFVEHHSDTYCACFASCDFSRPSHTEAATVKVYRRTEQEPWENHVVILD